MQNSIDHRDLWNLSELVDEYNNYKPMLTTAEHYLVNKAKENILNGSCNILCVGCGTGREILPLHESFGKATIYANDISENMLNSAAKNFTQWHIENYVKLLPGSVENIIFDNSFFRLITCFNNVFSYLLHAKERALVFKKLFKATQDGGMMIGMVHYIKGNPKKTIYFMLRSLLAFYLKDRWNNKQVGRIGQKYITHFYTRAELFNLLKNAGYKRIEIVSLYELYKMNNKKYNRLTGSNNLIFFAVKE